jgi:hypothetical protein
MEDMTVIFISFASLFCYWLARRERFNVQTGMEERCGEEAACNKHATTSIAAGKRPNVSPSGQPTLHYKDSDVIVRHKSVLFESQKCAEWSFLRLGLPVCDEKDGFPTVRKVERYEYCTVLPTFWRPSPTHFGGGSSRMRLAARLFSTKGTIFTYTYKYLFDAVSIQVPC